MSMAVADGANSLFSGPRRLLHEVQRGAAAVTAAVIGNSAGTRGGKQFGILMYHRVTDVVPGHPMPTWNVTPARLREQLTGLLKRGFQAWPLRKVLEYRRRRLALPRNVFVVTFDDGYANNYTQALKILAELKVPATVFLATAYLGSDEPFPSDDWSSKGSSEVPADAWRPLTLEECRALQTSGWVELGAHTHTHQDFRGRLDAFRDDLRQNQIFLSEQFGLTEASFAFPYGTKGLGFSGPALARVVREARFACGLTTEADLADVSADPFDWGRFQVDQRDSAAVIAGKLVGWYGLIRSGGRKLLAHFNFRRRAAGEAVMPVPLRLGRFR